MASVEGSGLEFTPAPPAPVLDVRAERRRRPRERFRAQSATLDRRGDLVGGAGRLGLRADRFAQPQHELFDRRHVER
jgi:hypothetical protein